jgi:hypothetical protein
MLLAVGDALGRARPPFRYHIALLFPDAEEPPNIRTDRMGSTWFWRHPPFPLANLRCALVFDLLAGPASPGVREAGLADAVFVLGAEASPGLARLAHSVPPRPGVVPLLLGLPLIEAYPFVPWRRFAQSDYHGLRDAGGRPFLFITGGRAHTYHTTEDTPATLDYARLVNLTRWVTRLLAHTAEDPWDLGWADYVADPLADARAVLRLYASIGSGSHLPWLLRRAVMADRARVQTLLHAWESAPRPPPQNTGNSPSCSCASRLPTGTRRAGGSRCGDLPANGVQATPRMTRWPAGTPESKRPAPRSRRRRSARRIALDTPFADTIAWQPFPWRSMGGLLRTAGPASKSTGMRHRPQEERECNLTG